ncbi:hypothetical protein GCM10027176_20060 [Actinoallomurus bryophytorum]|uniref:Uncharacterized protein n=1 Tax=Actinoallomurus bryophytorum TaxID=1490222 RepID=A0A543CKT4_9ACTN|nr:hypothetical protein [Actinoallomurus bryophytorum]TQL97716.1 hypothetical protein FB559_3317 [Actinoallomurus bryophytorum]
MKIIDRVKAYFQKKEGHDRSSGDPLDGAGDPVPAQGDGARHEQSRDDKTPAVSTVHKTPEPEPATEPAVEPVPDSIAEPAIEPTTDSAVEPATDPIAEPATEPAVELTTGPAPATQPAPDPIAEPATGLTTAPGACPRCGATGDAPCTTPSGKATKNHKGREQ